MNSHPILEARNVRKSFEIGDRSIEVLHGAHLELRKAERLCLMGSSGAGKSTFMHILGLLDEPTEGSVCIDGVDAWGLNINERAKLTGTAAQQKKYVNVAMGEKANGDMQEFEELLTAAGFTVSTTPGPLLLATTGGRQPSLKTMPSLSEEDPAFTAEIFPGPPPQRTRQRAERWAPRLIRRPHEV